MDDPSLDRHEHRRALRALARINKVSATAHHVWRALQPRLCELAALRRRHVRVIDIACGGGDVTLRLQQCATRAGLRAAVHGCDISPRAVALARAVARRRRVASRFFLWDLTGRDLPAGYDAIVCSLFLHHLRTPAVVSLLRRMVAAADVVVIDDLVRSRSGEAVARLATRALSRSRVVRNDGPCSVRAAFTPAELRVLAAAAGMGGIDLVTHFPWRMRLLWSRHARG